MTSQKTRDVEGWILRKYQGAVLSEHVGTFGQTFSNARKPCWERGGQEDSFHRTFAPFLPHVSEQYQNQPKGRVLLYIYLMSLDEIHGMPLSQHRSLVRA